jgi:hypothetical protein
VRLLCAVSAALLLSGCGYIGEPQYPLLNIPVTVKDMAAVQRGSAIIYQFTLPELTTEGTKVKIGQVEIRAGEFNANQAEWYSHSMRIEAAPDANNHVRSEIPATPWIGRNLTLAVKVFGPSGRDAGWSNQATVSVIPPLPKPADVKADPVSEGVRVSWQGPAGQYRILRRGETDKDYALVGTADTTQWLDTKTEYGKQYAYIVQAVQKVGAFDAESDLSDPKQVTPVDIFPPAVPSGLNAIAAANNIELVWDRNTESDLAGYRVYRSTAGGAFEKIADIPEAPSYSDSKLESGKQYRYTISAVDKSGNESKPSEPVEISAP